LLGGCPCSGEEAMDQLGKQGFEGTGDGVGGVTTVREKERDADEERDG